MSRILNACQCSEPHCYGYFTRVTNAKNTLNFPSPTHRSAVPSSLGAIEILSNNPSGVLQCRSIFGAAISPPQDAAFFYAFDAQRCRKLTQANPCGADLNTSSLPRVHHIISPQPSSSSLPPGRAIQLTFPTHTHTHTRHQEHPSTPPHQQQSITCTLCHLKAHVSPSAPLTLCTICSIFTRSAPRNVTELSKIFADLFSSFLFIYFIMYVHFLFFILLCMHVHF